MPSVRVSLLLFGLPALAVFGQGSNSPFQNVPPPVTDALRFGNPVADFEISDLTGHRWRASDLQGKVTLIDIWNTGCLPCRKEQPALEAFYDRARLANDIQVLTFAIDDEPGRVRRYMAENEYSFPVIVNRQLCERLFPPEGGLPKVFVIDREGRRSAPFKAWTTGRILIEAERFARTR